MRLRLFTESCKSESSQLNPQRRGCESLFRVKIERAFLPFTLRGVLYIKEHVCKRRPQIGAIQLENHLRAAAAQNKILPAMKERNFDQFDEGRR